jgi:hypothetical protein
MIWSKIKIAIAVRENDIKTRRAEAMMAIYLRKGKIMDPSTGSG